MGLWSWIKSSDPLAPPEPVYSELGEEIYKLLEEKEEEWVPSGRWDREYGIHHYKTQLFIELQKDNRSGINITHSGHYIHHLMTPDDRKRLERRARQVLVDMEKRRDYEDMKKTLEKIKPNPFSATTRELARCVLRGDDSAARPLIDAALEDLNGH